MSGAVTRFGPELLDDPYPMYRSLRQDAPGMAGPRDADLAGDVLGPCQRGQQPVGRLFLQPHRPAGLGPGRRAGRVRPDLPRHGDRCSRHGRRSQSRRSSPPRVPPPGPGSGAGAPGRTRRAGPDPLVEWRRRRGDRVDGRGGRPPPTHGRLQDRRSSAGGCADAAAVGVRGDRAALGRRLLRADGVPERVGRGHGRVPRRPVRRSAPGRPARRCSATWPRRPTMEPCRTTRPSPCSSNSSAREASRRRA